MNGENTESIIHVVFGTSAAGALKGALSELGRSEKVHYLLDDLSYGPIDPADPQLRAKWNVANLGEEQDPDLIVHAEEFWSALAAHPGTVVVWMSRRCATELCGFLEVVSRVGARVALVDVADTAFLGRDGAVRPKISNAFGFVDSGQIIEHKLAERWVLLSSAECDRYRAIWQRLREENAPLRVVTPTGLVSEPITFFDEAILSCVSPEWRRCSEVVYDAMRTCSTGPFRQGGEDAVLFSRLLTLVDDGAVEGRCEQEPWEPHETWVRRLPTQ